jgi:CheY-like chemotaxis protein
MYYPLVDLSYVRSIMPDRTIFLIIDDDQDDRLFFQNAVKEIDRAHECIVAQHGEDALALLQTAASLPHFIFLDLNMHLMHGKEVLVELKKNDKLKYIPVIIYSTSTYQKDIDTTKALGAAYYLVKPHNIQSLPEEILRAVEAVKLY